jgi:hypothetical protein
VERKELFCFEAAPPAPPTGTTRAASPQSIPPPPLAEAVEIVRKASNSGHACFMRLSAHPPAVQRMLKRFWPGYVRGKVATAVRVYGSFKPARDLQDWQLSFQLELHREGEAINRYFERRREWERKHPKHTEAAKNRAWAEASSGREEAMTRRDEYLRRHGLDQFGHRKR